MLAMPFGGFLVSFFGVIALSGSIRVQTDVTNGKNDDLQLIVLFKFVCFDRSVG